MLSMQPQAPMPARFSRPTRPLVASAASECPDVYRWLSYRFMFLRWTCCPIQRVRQHNDCNTQ